MSQVWAEFQKRVARSRDELRFRDGEECFFRGHADKVWPLLPFLLRHCRDQGIKKPAQVRAIEHALYFEFRARARELHAQTPEALDVLFHMRHHGLATRLLDWTEVLGVAVYFALNGGTTSAPCVWLLNPYALNEISWKARDLVAPEYLFQGDSDFAACLVKNSSRGGFDWKKPVALYPLQTNARLHAQRGYFTIHGEDKRPLEKIAPGVVRRVDLPKAAWEDARAFLEDAGINEYLLFPDLDGLTRHLHEKYGVREAP